MIRSSLKEWKPTVENARKALTDRVERSDKEVLHPDLLKMLLPPLKTDPINNESADEVTIGRWSCNLEERTWSVLLEFPNGDGHRINQWNGVFQRTQDDTWLAKVTGASSVH